MSAGVAASASPRGKRKLRAYPRATFTTSPRRPSLSTSWRRTTSISAPRDRRGRRARGPELVRAAAVAVAAAAQELHALGDDLDGLALGAVLRLPFAPVEAPVDRDRAALRQVLRAALGLIAEDRDAEVVRLVGPLAALVAAPAVDGDAQAADRGAGRRLADLRVARQVPDEHDAIDVGCRIAPLLGSVTQATPRPRRCHRRSRT